MVWVRYTKADRNWFAEKQDIEIVEFSIPVIDKSCIAQYRGSRELIVHIVGVCRMGKVES